MNLAQKILIIMGAAFIGIGSLVGITLYAALRMIPGSGFFLMIPLFFVILGACFIGGVVINVSKKKNIIRKGRKYTGKIYGYIKNTAFTVNGEFTSNTKVHYFDEHGIEREAIIPTGFTDGSSYPIGMTIDIYELNGAYNFDPKSVRSEILPGEEELMDDLPINPGAVKMVAVSCPSCGSSFNATSGYSNKCPYCNSYINA